MRTIYLDDPHAVGAKRRKHKFTFGPEHSTPSGIEGTVYLEAQKIGVFRGIDTLGPKGGPIRLFEVQLTTLYVANGPNLRLALQRVLPHALRLVNGG